MIFKVHFVDRHFRPTCTSDLNTERKASSYLLVPFVQQRNNQ